MSDDTILVSVPIPRSALVVVAPPPEMLSQRNVEAVAGIPAETYLRALRRPDNPVRVIADGRLRLVDRVAFLAWYKSGPAPTAPRQQPRDEVEAVLLEFGATLKR